MLEMLSGRCGGHPFQMAVRLPLIPPAIRQLSAAGEPYGDVIRHGQALLDADADDKDVDDKEVVGPPIIGPTFSGGKERVDLICAGSGGCLEMKVCLGGIHCAFFCDDNPESVAALPSTKIK